MQNNSSIFQIPGTAKKEAYNFATSKEDQKALSLYEELQKIGEEIEKCRLENS